MPVINFNTAAGRRAYAMLQDDLKDWKLAHEIASLKTIDERNAAIEKLAIDTDLEYAEEIKAKSTTVFMNRKAKAEARSTKATTALRDTFSKGKKPKKMTARASQATTKSNVSKLLDNLDQGVTA